MSDTPPTVTPILVQAPNGTEIELKAASTPTLIETTEEQKHEEKVDNTLTVTDNRTGKTYTLDITSNCIEAIKLLAIKDKEGVVTRSFDPAYMNTVCCKSSISFIDGDKGVLEYRGIPIRQLAENASLLETYFLIIYGELPKP